MPITTLGMQGLHPHPGPVVEETHSPTAEQRYRRKRKSIWEASDEEMDTTEAESRKPRTRPKGPQTKPAKSKDQTRREVEEGNPYLNVRGDAKWQEAFQETDGAEMQNGTSGDKKTGREHGNPKDGERRQSLSQGRLARAR